MYLRLYNAVSVVLWSLVLYNTLTDVQEYFSEDTSNYYISKSYEGYPHKFLVIVQLVNAAAEILHSITGLVPSPLGTVLLQFLARLSITVGVSYLLPESPGNSCFPAYISLSIAWSVTEIFRYGFYAVKLYDLEPPYWLVYLRYSLFFVMYPLGLFSELYVVYLSLKDAERVSIYYYYYFVAGLAMYVPGFIVLYSHMIRQRNKVLPRVRFRLK